MHMRQLTINGISHTQCYINISQHVGYIGDTQKHTKINVEQTFKT